jgi:hypothetical protein
MSIRLLLELQFSDRPQANFPSSDRPDVIKEDAQDPYEGLHLVSTNPGVRDRLTAERLCCGVSEESLLSLPPGKRIFVKNGPITRAAGIITRWRECESSAKTLPERWEELRGET